MVAICRAWRSAAAPHACRARWPDDCAVAGRWSAQDCAAGWRMLADCPRALVMREAVPGRAIAPWWPGAAATRCALVAHAHAMGAGRCALPPRVFRSGGRRSDNAPAMS
ncbi:hypothetical protein F511_46653 [Dorcoceras hygrometricum]|uniref:Uncharacterized protein n=1 Tax=Dorcoceras hygrometricum TaxID=472368 RepID=A0A2Z6ZT03_9LAMI|nr:hypothetical protein F511_46653 [Dorcoceras hygrometricum]